MGVMMRRASIFLLLILFVSGCTATSKSVKSDRSVKSRTSVVKDSGREERPTATKKITAVKVAAKTDDVPRSIKSPVVETPMTHSQITNVISEFLSIQSTENASGEPVFLGSSENKLVSLKLTGDARDISEASLELTYPEDIDSVNADLNNAMMLRFFRNISPGTTDWQDQVKEIVDRFHALSAGSREKGDIMSERGAIEVLYDKNKGAIRLTIRSR